VWQFVTGGGGPVMRDITLQKLKIQIKYKQNHEFNLSCRAITTI